MSKSKVLFLLSGSIAAFKACQVISRLVQDGFEVQTAATASALKFIGAATLEGLTGKPVLSDLWENGRAMDHIHLSRWADFGVLCPASANTINRAALGLGEDLVGNILLAWPKEKPLHVFPAMTLEMLSNANFTGLGQRGFIVHETASGALACGESGSGRLLEPEEILKRIVPPRRGRLLITSGATREPIDGIRFLSNVSTGQTGATLADRLSLAGWEVTYLHGAGAILPARAENIAYGSFAELNDLLRRNLSNREFDGVIHAAAVADYSVESVNNRLADENAKISSGDDLELKLKPNFKILPRLKEYSRNKNIKVVGFKLTLNGDAKSIARTMIGPEVNAVVANDWSQVAKDRTQHPGTFVVAGQERDFGNLNDLSAHLNEFLGGSHDSRP